MSTNYLLIVEDDEDIRMVMEETLRDEGYETDSARDGIEAMDILKAKMDLPQVILLDLMMPRMNGLAFRKAQLEDSRLSHIPVILFSADPKANGLAKEYQIEHCLKKPVDLDALFDLIASFLRK